MLSLTNPWVLVGVLSLVISSYFYGHHAAYVEQEAEVARLNLIERDKEQQMQQLANSHARELERANRDAKDKVTKLQSDIASGELRLSIATRSVQTCSDATSATGNTEARAELDPEASKSLVSITADGDSAIRQLNACIDIYNQVRSKQ
jgi:Bacteriophage Rz lysis protein